MLPPHEGLDRDDLARGQVDLGLVHQRQLVVGHGGPQVGLEVLGGCRGDRRRLGRAAVEIGCVRLDGEGEDRAVVLGPGGGRCLRRGDDPQDRPARGENGRQQQLRARAVRRRGRSVRCGQPRAGGALGRVLTRAGQHEQRVGGGRRRRLVGHVHDGLEAHALREPLQYRDVRFAGSHAHGRPPAGAGAASGEHAIVDPLCSTARPGPGNRAARRDTTADVVAVRRR